MIYSGGKRGIYLVCPLKQGKLKYNRRTIPQRNISLGELMETKPALEASLVQEFVGNAHGDLNRVKELLAQEPGPDPRLLGLGRRQL
jgi:hypothetical protein